MSATATLPLVRARGDLGPWARVVVAVRRFHEARRRLVTAAEEAEARMAREALLDAALLAGRTLPSAAPGANPLATDLIAVVEELNAGAAPSSHSHTERRPNP